MVTLSYASENHAADIYSVQSEIHVQGREGVVDNADGLVTAHITPSGNVNCEFQGPDSLDGAQRQACINAVIEHLAQQAKPDPAPAPAPARRSRARPAGDT